MPRDSRENQLSIYTYCIWLEFGVNIQLCLGGRDFNIVLDSKVLHSGFNSPEVQFNHLLLPPADPMAASNLGLCTERDMKGAVAYLGGSWGPVHPHLLSHSGDVMLVVLANRLDWLYIKLKLELVPNFI
ncbi:MULTISPECIES: hypothetical protein [Microcystis]|jgi:hypothetical protein|uniref:Uncharacterized protein n=2 Tax=Microcystis TaxID=1125 RepID=A0ABR8HQG4_9CHRO|nr:MULTISPECIES: hypothetical protein [Microcystis]KXS91472.1 hypothetical protein OA58_11155 [Microcystis aeruginosa NIES-88]MCA2509315.1 hypothetical protein [Microcystis sp. M60BS1]MCA2550824.1 hypothetical protein [Microcystis sp. M53BS1]MCA2559826.1 hypothetical protein [Microcystis sp. M43BS1]MCA2574621.1 hypothetical protein [Microcystis sp. M42BS1]MCA2575217.1 hypothetical protein [Microcystis sp. M41BS1]MCA2587969.1 hypothetical protein [Microcystis sp. M34BS1]MCA2598398.1 hypothet